MSHKGNLLGVFSRRSGGKKPTHLFAGDCTQHTSRRLHRLHVEAMSARLSTAFHSNTLHFRAPRPLPDIVGKIDVCTALQAAPYALFINHNPEYSNVYIEAITMLTEESVHPDLHRSRTRSEPLREPLVRGDHRRYVDGLGGGSGEQGVRATSERGGALGAMDTMYQRRKSQEKSPNYELQGHDDGSLPLIGVDTFLAKDPCGRDNHLDRADSLDGRNQEPAGR